MKLSLLLLTFTSTVFGAGVELNTYSTSLDFAQVKNVHASQKSDGSWCFDTSVKHNDQNWEHYADGWEVLDLNGNQLAYRLLGHPHINEQPFTRGKCNININIPTTISKVVVRAKCNKHGFGGKPIVVNLNASKGEGYLVSRND